MTIIPIQPLNSIADLAKTGQAAGSTAASSLSENPFQAMFQDAMNNVKDTDATLNNEIYKLSTGQSDDLHTLTIASTKASLAVDLMVQLRNKALDAYNEVMRMSV